MKTVAHRSHRDSSSGSWISLSLSYTCCCCGCGCAFLYLTAKRLNATVCRERERQRCDKQQRSLAGNWTMDLAAVDFAFTIRLTGERHLSWIHLRASIICCDNLHWYVHEIYILTEISCRQLKPFTKALQLMEVNNVLLQALRLPHQMLMLKSNYTSIMYSRTAICVEGIVLR